MDLSFLYNQVFKGPPEEASPVNPWGPVIYSVTKEKGGYLGLVCLGITPSFNSNQWVFLNPLAYWIPSSFFTKSGEVY